MLKVLQGDTAKLSAIFSLLTQYQSLPPDTLLRVANTSRQLSVGHNLPYSVSLAEYYIANGLVKAGMLELGGQALYKEY